MPFEIIRTSPFWREPRTTKLTPNSNPIKAGNDGNHHISLVIMGDDSFQRIIGNDSDGIVFRGTSLADQDLQGLFGPLNRTPIEHLLFVKKTLKYKPK